VLGARPALGHPAVKVVEHAAVVVAVHERHEQVRAGLRCRRGPKHVLEAEALAVVVVVERGGRVKVLVPEEVVHLALGDLRERRVLPVGLVRERVEPRDRGEVDVLGVRGEAERAERLRDGEVGRALRRGDELAQRGHVDERVVLLLLLVFVLDNGVARVKHHAACAVDAEVVHEQAAGAALVKVLLGLLEERVDRELEVELLDLERGERLGERGL
jgi:hypothetical protein